MQNITIRLFINDPNKIKDAVFYVIADSKKRMAFISYQEALDFAISIAKIFNSITICCIRRDNFEITPPPTQVPVPGSHYNDNASLRSPEIVSIVARSENNLEEEHTMSSA
ncbi:hypothetical protein [Desulfovibrio inopinatus]|uniref:hypothetical protein n=1 Tax=Desulfovibrio inopinatus TaxID=102109 RepID=UPI0004158BC6|nr:hypothetical protein [Desulfovibrio inopinatus]